MNSDTPAIDSLLKRSISKRASTGLTLDSPKSAFRLVNKEADGAQHIAVDKYGEWFVVHFYAPMEAHFEAALFDALMRLGPRGVYIKRRPRQANVIVNARAEQYAPHEPVRGEKAPFEIAIEENGLEYQIRLYDGLSTGIFLDQRHNRKRIFDHAKDKRVLNLFSYTAGFSIAAAAGGAREVVNVDASKQITAKAIRNVEHSHTPQVHRFVVDDVFSYLHRLKKRQELFDCIILDPPSYSTTRSARFSAERDYTKLVDGALSVLAKGGILLTCTNLQNITPERFYNWIKDAFSRAGRSQPHIQAFDPPDDFPPPPTGIPHLKSLWST